MPSDEYRSTPTSAYPLPTVTSFLRSVLRSAPTLLACASVLGAPIDRRHFTDDPNTHDYTSRKASS